MPRGTNPIPIPPLLLITDRKQARRSLVEVIAAALDAGCRWISVREKDLGEAEQIAVVTGLRPLAERYGARLTLHGEAGLAQRANADGVHLPAGADAAAARRLLGPNALVGISVHRPDELSHLVANVDYVVVGPAYATASKPGYGPVLGPAGVVGFVRDMPVIAIGGISRGNLAPLMAAGAAGIAVMGGVMRANDPGDEVRALLAAIGAR